MKQLNWVIFLLLSSLFVQTKLSFANQDKIQALEHFRMAESLRKQNKLCQAIEYYEKSLLLKPENWEALFHLGCIKFNQDNIPQAISSFHKALNLKQDIEQIHYNLGLCYLKSEDNDKAKYHFKQATKINKQHTKSQFNLATILEKEKKYPKAINCYKQVVKYEPTNVTAYHKLGDLYRDQENLEQAAKYFKKAYNLSTEDIILIMKLANTLNMLDHNEEAMKLYLKALEKHPKMKSALYNFGYTLKKLGKVKKAVQVYKKVLEMYPDYAMAHFGVSLAQLTLGNFDEGWKEHEWRWEAYNEKPKQFNRPTWEGQELDDKTIFVYAEQGLGDTFQFIRYCKVLKNMGAQVIFQTQRVLTRVLAQGCPYIDKVIPRGESLPNFDYHIPLMSLPMVLKTRLETIPADIPYIEPSQTLVKKWKEKLQRDSTFKVGICWQGNAKYRTASLRRAVAAKSIDLKKLARLSRIPGVSLYSLQKVNGTDQLDGLDSKLQVKTFGPNFDEQSGPFMDTAAIIPHLDLVISVDTSIGHLAGALGGNVWLILPEPADWRWLLDRDDTPWYPHNMRLFRQPSHGDWDGVIDQLCKELKKLLGISEPTVRRDKPLTDENPNFADALEKIIELKILQQLTPSN